MPSSQQTKQVTGLRCHLLPLLFLVGFIVSCPLSVRFHEAETTQDIYAIDDERLKHFPVLVITPQTAAISRLADLPELPKTHKNYSFLVPSGKESFYQEQLKSSFKGDATTQFEVEQISLERQKIKLGLYGDGKTVAWYEATDKEVFPQKEQRQGPMDAVAPLVYSLLVSTGIVILAAIMLKVLGLRK